MPQEIQNGKAIVYGIVAATGQQIQIPGYAGFILESVKIVHKHDQEVIKDENNATTTLIATDGHKEVDIMFVPAALASNNTKDGAYDSCVFIPPQARVELSGFKVDPGPGETKWNTDPWVRQGDQTIDLTHKEGELTLKVRQYDNNVQNDLL